MQRVNVSSLLIAALVAIGSLTWATPALSVDPTGVWKLTGSMATSRRNAQRELLPDGTNFSVIKSLIQVFPGHAERVRRQ
ncbi:MAG: hypothetical protein Q8S00_10415 [Deltaproteobacteria bacterium]|nr:hypothetical protein [Deltaproteobacteria bacterium]